MVILDRIWTVFAELETEQPKKEAANADCLLSMAVPPSREGGGGGG